MTTRSMSDLDRKIDENHAEVNTRIVELRETMNTVNAGMEELRNLIISQGRNLSQESNNNQQTPPPPPPRNQTEPNQPINYSTRISKVDFPRFDGRKVKDWLYKCDQFFLLDETPPEQRVRLASIHLEGLALQWHLNYMRSRFDEYPLWSRYAADVRRRFGFIRRSTL